MKTYQCKSKDSDWWEFVPAHDGKNAAEIYAENFGSAVK